MKRPVEQAYPDVSDIFQRKAEARKENAALSFGEKIKRLEALRERHAARGILGAPWPTSV